MLSSRVFSSLRSAVGASRMTQTGFARMLSQGPHGGPDPNPGLAEYKHGRKETEDEFDNRYLNYFNRPDIDSWELRKGINDLHGMDLIPEPKIIIAALEAARRLNDHSIAVRFLEALRWKSRGEKDVYPYIMQEIKPTLQKLGISTPEELGFDQPELTIPDAMSM